jgi:hypothetical protein
MHIQTRIPAAICAIHNFISIHDPAEGVIYTGDNNAGDALADHNHVASAAEVNRPSARWNHIAQEM